MYGNRSEHESHIPCVHCSPKHRVKWYKERLFLVLLVVFGLIIVNYISEVLGHPILHSFVVSFYDYVSMIWFPLLLGILVGGIDYFVPKEYVMRVLAKHDKKTIIILCRIRFLSISLFSRYLSYINGAL